ncbi:hypothetical protein Tco_1378086 [Tanacetum coccineum]
MVVQAQAEMGEGSANPTDPHHNRNTTLLDAEQDRGNINKTQSKATPNEAGSQGTTSGGGPRRQETIGDTIAQTRVSELQRLIEVVPDKEEVAIDAIPLATKPPSIVDYKIHKEGKKTYYQIIRADGSSKMYLVFSHMLKSFDMEDLETLWKLVKAKHGSTRPEEGYERVLWGDLKTMFDPHVEDQVWRNQQDYKVLDWKIYDSCGVHSLRMQHMHIHMLVEKRYPLTPATITDMLNKKLQCDHFSEMLSMKKLEILKKNIKFRGGLLGLKDFLMILELLLLRCVKSKVDGAQSSRVPVPLPEDPYEAIRQAYFNGTDTEFEPFEDRVDTKTPESPLTIAPPISLSESTPPIFVPILRKTACMVVRVPPAMSSGLSASMAEVAAMSESSFRTSELVEDSEEDDDDKDEEIKESMDSDSVSEDAEDEGPTAEDEDPAARDEDLTAEVEGLGMDDESYGLDDESHGMDDEIRGLDDEGHGVKSDGIGLEEEEEAIAGGQQQAALVMGTAGSGSAPDSERPERVSASRQPTRTTCTDLEDGMVYIDVPAYPPLAPPIQTPPSPEWTSGLLPISPSPFVIPSPISSPIIPLTIPSPVATPATTKIKGFLTELGAQVEMQGELIRDHAVRLEELSPALFERYDKDIGELFTRSGAGKNQDLRLQLAEERCARLELAEVVNGARRGQEPKRDA